MSKFYTGTDTVAEMVAKMKANIGSIESALAKGDIETLTANNDLHALCEIENAMCRIEKACENIRKYTTDVHNAHCTIVNG